MFEFFNIFVAVLKMIIKKIFRVKLLRTATTLVKNVEKNNIHVFKLFIFNFN